MARYRRARLEPRESLVAGAVSLAVAVGAAAVTFYVTRLLLSRDEMSPGGGEGARRTLPKPRSKRRIGGSTDATP